MDHTQQLLEAAMMVLFGTSWPFSIVRVYRAKSSKGKSFIFLTLLLLGYVAGMISKLVSPTPGLSYVFWFLLANFVMVAFDFALCIYYRKKENAAA